MTLPKLIRLPIDIARARGGYSALDETTGLPPAFWNLEACTLDTGLFSDATTAADVTDLTKLRLVISLSPGHAAPIVDQSASLDLTMTAADWTAGSKRHGRWTVAASALAVDFAEGESSKQAWLAIWAIQASAWICLVNMQITIYRTTPVGS
jgi:hypothetical protein